MLKKINEDYKSENLESEKIDTKIRKEKILEQEGRELYTYRSLLKLCVVIIILA